MQKNFFSNSFRRHIIFSLKSTALKINFVLNFFSQAFFKFAQQLYEKSEGSESGDPYLWLTDPDLGGPKTVEIKVFPTIFA